MKDDVAAGVNPSPASAAQDALGSNTEIGRKLKQYFDGLVSPDVPDRFEQLLKDLEAAERSQGRG